MLRGEIVGWYSRGFGFVRAEGRKDYFLHARKIVNRIVPRIGDLVDFELGEPYKAGQLPEAINATIIPVADPKTDPTVLEYAIKILRNSSWQNVVIALLHTRRASSIEEAEQIVKIAQEKGGQAVQS